MALRLAKTVLVAAVALFYTLVVFNNLTDYGANAAFVHHVLLMDSIFPGNHATWRAIHALWVQTAFYDGIIAWEIGTTVVLWAAAWWMLRAAQRPVAAFERAKGLAVIGLTVGLLMWLVAFLSVGGEWFLMWQSATWNGQQEAFRMFAVVGLVLLLVALPESAPAKTAG